jgi:hypothetical protein
VSRRLKPQEKVALGAALVAMLGGLTPVLLRTWAAPGQDRVMGLPEQFVPAALLALIGLALVVSVGAWLKRRPG